MTILEIKEYMRKNKISQIELSEKSSIPLQTIRKIFAGITPNPRIDTMQAIEKALGINQEPKNDFNKIPVALYEGINGLSEEGMQDVLRYVEFVKSKEKEKGGK